MKRIDIKNIKECLDGISPDSIKFLIIVEKNKQLLSKEFELIKTILERAYLEEYKTIEQERQSILSKYSNKDKDGNPILKNNSYDLDKTKMKEFEEDMTLFNSTNKEIIEKQNLRLKDVEAFMLEEVDIELFKISLEEFPDEYSEHLEILEKMID